MIPKKAINQCELWIQSVTFALNKTDWDQKSSMYCAFENADVPAYTAEEIFPEVIELTMGRKIRRVKASVEENRAEAQYEIIKEGQEVPRPKKKRATRKKVVKED